MNPCRLLACLALAVLLSATPALHAADVSPPQATATVKKDGKKLSIDLRMTVQVPLNVAWDVMTDFGNMARYLPNLSASDIQHEEANVLRVTQKGTVHWGPLGFDFESVRRVRLQPMTRIESTTLSGKISKMISLCELNPANDAIDIVYHADAEIDFWLPPLVGTGAMQSELEEQFSAMATEMQRRHASR